MAIHSSVLDWRIPWTEGSGRLQSMGSQRVDTTEQLTPPHIITEKYNEGSCVDCFDYMFTYDLVAEWYVSVNIPSFSNLSA